MDGVIGIELQNALSSRFDTNMNHDATEINTRFEEIHKELLLCAAVKTLLASFIQPREDKSLRRSSSRVPIHEVKLSTPDEFLSFVSSNTHSLKEVLNSQAAQSIKMMNVHRTKKLLYDYCLSEIAKVSTFSACRPAEVIKNLSTSYKDIYYDFPHIKHDLKPSEEIIEVPYSQTIHSDLGHDKFSLHELKISFEKFFADFIPYWIKDYNRDKLKGDLIAGVTVGVMSVPQGMAYAIIAGLPPIYGLYASTIPLLIYALLGSSRELAVGPFALVSLLVYSAVSPFAEPQTTEFIALVTLTSFFVGIQLILLGLFRVGFVVNFLSHPVLDGFNTAAACIIATSQLPSLFGFSAPRTSEFYLSVYNFFSGIGGTSVWSLLLGVTCIGILQAIKVANGKLKAKGWIIPGPIVILVISLFFSFVCDLEHNAGIKVVGDIPQGLPPISTMPKSVSWRVARSLFLDSFFISLVAFTSSISVGKKYSDERKYPLNSNQELVALGMANLLGGFFSSYPVSGSLSRTVVNASSGANTQMAGIFSVAVVLLSLLILTPVLYYLPSTVLAAVVIMAVVGLVSLDNIKEFWKIKKADLVIWVFAAISTLIAGIGNGILVSVLFSMVLVFYRSTRPHTAILGRLPGSITYRNVRRFPNALVIPGLIIMRVDDSLFFANINFFKDKLQEIMQAEKIEIIVLDFSSVNDIDTTACKVFKDILRQLRAHNVLLLVASVKLRIGDIMKRAGLVELIGTENFYWELHDAAMFAARLLKKKRNTMDASSDDEAPSRRNSVVSEEDEQYTELIDFNTEDEMNNVTSNGYSPLIYHTV